jgi:hypothetical protein
MEVSIWASFGRFENIKNVKVTRLLSFCRKAKPETEIPDLATGLSSVYDLSEFPKAGKVA